MPTNFLSRMMLILGAPILCYLCDHCTECNSHHHALETRNHLSQSWFLFLMAGEAAPLRSVILHFMLTAYLRSHTHHRLRITLLRDLPRIPPTHPVSPPGASCLSKADTNKLHLRLKTESGLPTGTIWEASEGPDGSHRRTMCRQHGGQKNEKGSSTMQNMQNPKTCDNTLQPTPQTFGGNTKNQFLFVGNPEHNLRSNNMKRKHCPSKFFATFDG